MTLSKNHRNIMADQNCNMELDKTPNPNESFNTQNEKKTMVTDFAKSVSEAIESGNYAALKKLKHNEKKTFSQLASGKKGVEWLFQACDVDQWEIVESLLKAGVNPAERTEYNEYPLNEAKSSKVAELLLRYGACVDGYKDDFEPILRSVEWYNKEVVDVLVQHGAKIDTRTLVKVFNKYTNRDGDKIARELKSQFLNYDFEPNQCNQSGDSLLSLMICESSIEDVEAMIVKGADVNYCSKPSKSPIIVALLRGNNDMIQLLLKKGLTLEGEVAMKAIFEAAYRGGSILQQLIDRVEKWDFTLVESHKALAVLLEKRKFDIFMSLINFGFDINLEIEGKTLLSYMFHQNNWYSKYDESIIRYIISLGARFSNNDCAFPIHKCIADAPMLLMLNTLIGNAGFSPVIFKYADGDQAVCENTQDKIAWQLGRYRRRSESVIHSLNHILSPLCTALVCGQISLAKEMLKNHYVTNSDLTKLPRDEHIRQLMKPLRIMNRRRLKQKRTKIINFLDVMSTTVFSLFQLSFSVVSDYVGQQPYRGDRVKQLGVPPYIERMLMFSDESQHFVAGDDREDDNYDYYDYYTDNYEPSDDMQQRLWQQLSMIPGPSACNQQ